MWEERDLSGEGERVTRETMRNMWGRTKTKSRKRGREGRKTFRGKCTDLENIRNQENTLFRT